MYKCKRCGASFFFHYRVQLADTAICRKCFNELGFGKNLLICSDVYKYEEIKDGYDAYIRRRRAEKVKEHITAEPLVQIHGGERDLICTEEERSIFNLVEDYLTEHDIDCSTLRLARFADAYLTIRFMHFDLARFKYTIRAQWMTFPVIESRNDHHKIDLPDQLSPELEDLLEDAAAKIIEWSDKED